MTASVREPAVAGLFYPAEAEVLRHMVEDFLSDAPTVGMLPKAIIVPHAGYIYSGPVAASVYARLAANNKLIRRVVLLGPSHRVAFKGLAAPDFSQFRTPLGNIPIDRGAIAQLDGMKQVIRLDEAHAEEHSLEVQLPFLQLLLEDFELIPLVVGDASGEAVAEVLERLWGGPETLIVISSDLSHYHDYLTAKQMDQATSEAIASLHPEKLGYEDACGRTPVKGLLLQAKRLGLKAEIVDLRNSGDTAGDKNRVVGYGAYAFSTQGEL
ncbi:MAG: AmmeMemoRadiSam system protein B [Candidatus Thiodiazotropha sp. (ex Notomyrtea botanica)]|nr:AmmeMemoRadiSam system protein B [Candidatus Thiodiazotropha sp. (ex Notomyrtea botanica)]